MLPRPNLGKYLLSSLAVLPAFILGFFIIKYSVNVPFWDEWVTPGESFEKIAQGKLSFGYLMAQHNEHRVFFPKLILIPLALFIRWNVQFNMLVSLIFAGLISLNVYYLNRLTVGGSQKKSLFLAFLSNLLIFSLVQYENWLWGLQIAFFMPILCITSCLTVIYSPLKMENKVWLCIALSTISTFSLASGFLCWLIWLPLLILFEDQKIVMLKRKLTLVWLSAFTLNIFVYFYQYNKPDQSSGMKEALTHFSKIISYLLTFLGAPLSGFNVITAQIVGFCLLGLFMWLSVLILPKCLSELDLRYRVLPWFALGMYVLASGAITTVGRLILGVEQALSPRYTTSSIYLIVSLIHLIAIATDQFNFNDYYLNVGISKNQPAKHQNLVRAHFKVPLNTSIPILIICFLGLHLLSSITSLQAMKTSHKNRLYAKSCLILINVVRSNCVKQYLFQSRSMVVKIANQAEQLGLLEPDLATSSDIQELKAAPVPSNLEYGRFDSLERASPNQYTAKGWAVLRNRKTISDAIVLTYSAPLGKKVIFFIAPVETSREDVAQNLGDSAYRDSGWETSFSIKRLPKGRLKINAWAFDSITGKAFKLQSSHIIQH